MKVSKLVLCILLSLTLVVTFIPVMSFAQDDGADVQATEEVTVPEEDAAPAADVVKEVEDAEEPVLNAKEIDGIIKVGNVFDVSGTTEYLFIPEQDDVYLFYSSYDSSYTYEDVDPEGEVYTDDDLMIEDETYGNFTIAFAAKKGENYYLCSED